MIPVRARRTAAAAATAALALAGAACGSSSAAVGPADPPTVSLSGARVTPSGTWLTLPMGIAGNASETFWQTFVLPPGGTRWVLRTPPGVDDNGGLVVASGAGQVVVGIRPSANLHFSPLAITTDGGRHYRTGLLPIGLGDGPDDLSVAAGPLSSALGGGRVLTSRSGSTAWHLVATEGALRAGRSVRLCTPSDLVAVASTSDAVFVGSSCVRPGQAGVLRLGGPTGRGPVALVGPHLAGTAAGATVSIVRMAPFRRGVAVLLAVTRGSSTGYLAAWDPAGATAWTLSPLWRPGGPLLSASLTASGGFVALAAAGPGGALRAAVSAPGAPAWAPLPSPPQGTAVVAVSGSRVDAVRGGRVDFVDSVLRHGRWVQAQVTAVSVPYGSSS